MLNNHVLVINTGSNLNASLIAMNIPKRGTRKVQFNQEQVEKARRIRTNAEMADVTRMGQEIELKHFSNLPEWERTDERKQGPAVVAISNNPNTYKIEELYDPRIWDYLKKEVA